MASVRSYWPMQETRRVVKLLSATSTTNFQTGNDQRYPFYFFLDIGYRIGYSPMWVSLYPQRQATAAFLLPGRSFSLLNPLECALPRSVGFCTILVQISPLEYALTKKGEGGGVLFNCRLSTSQLI